MPNPYNLTPEGRKNISRSMSAYVNGLSPAEKQARWDRLKESRKRARDERKYYEELGRIYEKIQSHNTQ